jgi:hypothetical protein
MIIYQPDISGSVNITGSLTVTQGITGSLEGTASFAQNIPLDTVPTSGSSNAVSSNGVFDALALKQPILIKRGLTDLTGVTGVNVLDSLLIPANWLASGDGIEIFVIPIKSVTASAINYSIYSDTTINGTSKAIATGLSLSTANRAGIFQRICVLDATTLRNSTIVAAAQPLPIAANSMSSTTVFDPTVANYITITVNPTVISEVVGFNQFFIRKL